MVTGTVSEGGAEAMTGRQTLASIYQGIRDARIEAWEIERQLAAASTRLVALDLDRSHAIASLAAVHVGMLAEGRVQGLERSAELVREALADHQRGALELERQLAESAARLSELEAHREVLGDELEVAAALLDAAEAEAQRRLQGDAAYRRQRERAVEAERTSRHAADKARAAEAEGVARRRDFERDTRFTYLWRRGYGTGVHRALPLTRWLDGVVARAIDYERARGAYERSLELPLRLHEHAAAMVALAAAERAELERRDAAARSAAGAEALARARDDAAEALRRHDAQVEDAAERVQERLAALTRHAGGSDDAYRTAAGILEAVLGGADVQALRREAIATPFPEDDAIVERLVALELERPALLATVDGLKRVAASVRERIAQLERLRSEFSRAGFDLPGSTFRDGRAVQTIVSEHARGAVPQDQVWFVLEREQGYAEAVSRHYFGSGALGHGTIWSGGGFGGHRPRGLDGLGGFGGFGSFADGAAGAAGELAGRAAGQVAGEAVSRTIGAVVFRTIGAIVGGAFRTLGRF